jgi:hypothetical protein
MFKTYRRVRRDSFECLVLSCRLLVGQDYCDSVPCLPKAGHFMRMKLAMYKLRKFIYMIFPPCVFIGLLVFLPWAIFVAPPDIWRVLPNTDGQITDAMSFRAKVGGCIVGTFMLIVSGLETLRTVKRIIKKRHQK